MTDSSDWLRGKYRRKNNTRQSDKLMLADLANNMYDMIHTQAD